MNGSEAVFASVVAVCVTWLVYAVIEHTFQLVLQKREGEGEKKAKA